MAVRSTDPNSSTSPSIPPTNACMHTATHVRDGQCLGVGGGIGEQEHHQAHSKVTAPSAALGEGGADLPVV